MGVLAVARKGRDAARAGTIVGEHLARTKGRAALKDPAATAFAGAVGGGLTARSAERRRQAGQGVSKAMGPSYRGAKGTFAGVSHAHDLLYVSRARKSPIDNRLQVVTRRSDRSGGLAPVGTSRTRSRPTASAAPSGNARGSRLR